MHSKKSLHYSFEKIEQQNRAAYNAMARNCHQLASVATKQELQDPLPAIDTSGWLGSSIRGWRVLCLAAGGGRHGPLYAAAGAEVTVLDISDDMLELDRRVLQQYGLNARLIRSSMADMPNLLAGEFDLVVHPVSTCYVGDVIAVFREVARVLRAHGLYISQHKQPMNLQTSLHPQNGKYCVETETDQPAMPASMLSPSPLREPDTIEFAHSLESILGGICRSGMVIEDVREPDHANSFAIPGSIGHRSRFIPPYLRVKARKLPSQDSNHLIIA
jgi:ubiquinone/menaquinone biosynthesis C-methylase UbiE